MYSLFGQDSTIIKGAGNRKMIEKAPYTEWSVENYEHYSPDAKVMQKCARNVKDGLKFTIVTGTWCSDSKREVPRFLKILDILQIPANATSFIFLDRAKDDGAGEAKKLGVITVPTFIVYNGEGKELGRIVEKPNRTLEKDLLGILR